MFSSFHYEYFQHYTTSSIPSESACVTQELNFQSFLNNHKPDFKLDSSIHKKSFTTYTNTPVTWFNYHGK